LMELKISVEQKRRYDVGTQAELRRALQRERALVARSPETRENSRVKRRCENEVRQELPPEAFFVPTEVNHAAEPHSHTSSPPRPKT
jgi:hypothetical protein